MQNSCQVNNNKRSTHSIDLHSKWTVITITISFTIHLERRSCWAKVVQYHTIDVYSSTMPTYTLLCSLKNTLKQHQKQETHDNIYLTEWKNAKVTENNVLHDHNLSAGEALYQTTEHIRKPTHCGHYIFTCGVHKIWIWLDKGKEPIKKMQLASGTIQINNCKNKLTQLCKTE